eukprot:GHVO01056766.1.p1 GENE.GHVO01056766.1~~GHVO01056766.1.p1  ORF type:complete len:535 (+),score=94.72 GHVO01056766.1:20-1624(+)
MGSIDLESPRISEPPALCEVNKCSNVRIGVRVRGEGRNENTRPSGRLSGTAGTSVFWIDSNKVHLSREGRPNSYLGSQQRKTYEYVFDEALAPTSTQIEVYDRTTAKIVRRLLQGTNGTVFVYGATNAGKTHTMFGTPNDPGIVHRSIWDIFDRGVGGVYISIFEVYNENIKDLIDPSRTCELAEDGSDVHIRNLTEVYTTQRNEIESLVSKATRIRMVEVTDINKTSSRSHAVVQISIETPKGRRRLSLVDLAGSERASITNNKGIRLKEGAHINKSLLALANCINSLADGADGISRVKYRDSKLTHILKPSLEGDCVVFMIACVHPSTVAYEDNRNTLKYASRAKFIKQPGKSNGQDAKLIDEKSLAAPSAPASGPPSESNIPNVRRSISAATGARMSTGIRKSIFAARGVSNERQKRASDVPVNRDLSTLMKVNESMKFQIVEMIEERNALLNIIMARDKTNEELQRQISDLITALYKSELQDDPMPLEIQAPALPPPPTPPFPPPLTPPALSDTPVFETPSFKPAPPRSA